MKTKQKAGEAYNVLRSTKRGILLWQRYKLGKERYLLDAVVSHPTKRKHFTPSRKTDVGENNLLVKKK